MGLNATLGVDGWTVSLPFGGINQKKKIAVGILGQSNERGQVNDTPESTWQQAFSSLKNPGMFYPMAGNLSTATSPYRRQGGPWMKFYDDLIDWGYEPIMFNGAVGSLSLIADACGLVRTRSNSTGYSKYSPPRGPGDRGFYGDLTVQSSKLFRCSDGRERICVLESPWAVAGGAASQYNIDYVTTIGSQATAGADPGGWAAATLGSTIADGTVTWTCIDATNSVGFSNNQILGPNQISYGFDPSGLLTRIHMEMQRIRDVEDKYIIICNGQSDHTQSASNYQSALQNITNFFLQRGYKVVLGLSTYFAASSTANYNNLTTGLNSALSTFSSNSNVKAGANLYTLMGTDTATFCQADNLHWDAEGAIVAGGHWANAFKSFLPRVP